MRKESRSLTRGSAAKQQTQTKIAETVVTPRKQSRKTSASTSSKDTKSVSKSRSAASLSPGRSRDVKQASAADSASHDTAASSSVTQQQQQPDPNVSQDKVGSARKDKTAGKTLDKGAAKSRRWVRGGPIEYSTPPSDHSNDKTAGESVAVKQKSTCDSRESTKGKSSSKKNVASAFDGSDKESGARQSVPSTAAGGKRKKNPAQQGSAAESKGSSMPKGTSRKNAAAAVKLPEPDTTRTKRMARLNAEAIVSLIYKHDEPAAQSSKFHDSSDSDVDTDSSEFSSEDEHSRVVQKKRAKKSLSRDDAARHSEKEGELGGSSSSKKQEVHATKKRSSSKSDKSAKSQPKVSSKSCKQKSVEAPSSSSWSPPKRMASLNAQVCLVLVSN